MTETPAPEFSRIVEAPRVVGRAAVRRITAEAAERTAVAARFGLLALDRLDAEVRLERQADGLVRLEASFSAEVVQECVATLEPLPATVSESFTLLYGKTETGRTVVLDGDDEPIERMDGDRIDIGEAVAQQLSLVLEPFPRHPDAG